jgi:pimeloyl-ACP methyl ester carboxylesterase
MRRFVRRAAVALGLLVVLSSTLPFAAAANPTPANRTAANPAATPDIGPNRPGPKVVSKKPCPESRFTCITLRVPRDHFSAASNATFDVTFGLLKATGHRKGIFVTVTGGPGTSGLAAADGYTDLFDAGITKNYDIVFFDQRGVGVSEVLQCPDAALAFYNSDAVPTVSHAQALAYASDAKTFAKDCIDETGVDPSALPFYSTRQAVEDLEAFRVYLKADQLDLYGESYGTQYVQTYAAAHPNRVRALYVDGPVDLTLDGYQFWAEGARAFDSVVSKSLDRCTAKKICRSDVVGGNALKTYDKLVETLKNGPKTYSYIKPNGKVETRTFSLGDLESGVASYAYETYDRMLIQRAIAQASRGEFLPLARLSYFALGQDPNTLEAIFDPTWSDAMYYAVDCMDYAYGSGSAANRAAQFLAAGEAANVDEFRIGSDFYGDLPCAYWPAHPPNNDRPAYLTDTPYPIFVLASTWDPATPYPGALRIFNHADDAYLIVTPGGPHVIFGRGNECPDALVTAWIVDGERPAHRRTNCDFMGTDPYAPIPAKSIDDYKTGLAAMSATDDEIYNSPDYWNWDFVDPLQIGCLKGGSLRWTPTDDGARIRLTGCTFTAGFPLTGRGEINDTDGTFSLDITSPGGTKLSYFRDADGNRSVTGTFRGSKVAVLVR